ncbi:hydroxyisourate hydrolase [Sphingobacterium faecium]|jgi:5-hydroxyisourate hydrolase|uniref:hydroxyisourate hydrolase n=1 Tax=Sphingobacterium faecium TaxID=34087 RepID=UPI0004E5F500|nr:hydroxyisourate hydrolase [Sphingobacterium faecium]UXD69445.1 hydroxyisourate hydrolase [Sphingobacterium faecium]CDS92402.1 5-hydroxyisourate hydrolase [Sphingobacterium sp. PM2-P1-29]
MKKIILAALLYLSCSAAFVQAQTYQLSSHILDISTGLPAPEVPVKLQKWNEKDDTWTVVDQKITDENGRIKDFLEQKNAAKGVYKLTFLVADYFKNKQVTSFYPFIEVVFEIKDNKHYHVPITLSPFGYSTYRGN